MRNGHNTGFLSGLRRAFIGWFLNDAVVAGYRQLVIQDLLQHVTVDQLMSRRVPTVAPNIPISSLVHDYIMGTEARAFPVIANGHLVGLVCIQDVRKVPCERWDTTEVGEIMTAANRLSLARPEMPVSEAFEELAARDVNQLPVVNDDQVVGMLCRADLVCWLQRRPQSGRSPVQSMQVSA